MTAALLLLRRRLRLFVRARSYCVDGKKKKLKSDFDGVIGKLLDGWMDRWIT